MHGRPIWPPEHTGPADRRGTTICCTAAGPVEVEAIERLVSALRERIPGLNLRLR